MAKVLGRSGAVGVMLGLCFLACGGGGAGPPSNVSPASGGACGVPVFRTPACEQTLDVACCSQKVACAADQACNAIATCLHACRGRQSGGACQTDCVTQKPATPERQQGMQKLYAIFGCGEKSGGAPPGVHCGDED
jgi:hypothetical protein